MTQIRIVYCSPSGFVTQAKELENSIRNEFTAKVDIELVKSDKGIFDVYLDDKQIFSKFKEKRFPEFDEIKEKLIESIDL